MKKRRSGGGYLEGDELAGVEVEPRCECCPTSRLLERVGLRV